MFDPRRIAPRSTVQEAMRERTVSASLPPSAASPQLERFEILRSLGGGAAGMVYEARDRATGARVALKTLRFMNSETLLQLKSEFRALHDIEHPNLIRLEELTRDGDTWLFTMELVNGVPFSSYVTGDAALAIQSTLSSDGQARAPVAPPAGAPWRFDEARLRDGLSQLARGLSALHAAGKVHRDIKPANVLVTLEGRVVILDLGLARDAESEAEEGIVGTVLYMAPEQIAGEQVETPCDWYAVGGILYFCLTGHHPFEGPMFDVLTRKMTETPGRPSEHAAGVPPDLERLCIELLAPDPAARPTGAEVLKRLEQGTSALSRAPVLPASLRAGAQRPFVGRDAELQALTAAFLQTRAGRAVSVVLEGESGIGKSALARRFARAVPAFYSDVLRLSGRCHPRENLPYKAIDGIVDGISEHLASLSPSAASALLPSAIPLLARVFPVLQQAASVRGHSQSFDLEAVGMQEGRVLLFAAVRELFARLAAACPLLLVIDDIQWADGDSLAMLAEILRPPAPPLLLLATIRGSLDVRALPFETRSILVGRLTPDESVDLARALIADPEENAALADAIARESGGHPLLLAELVRHARAVGGQGVGTVTLDELFAARIAGLEPAARRLLEILSVAGVPLHPSTAARAADVPPAASGVLLRALHNARLARTPARGGDELAEVYQDRVRNALLSRLDPDALRGDHERLARALEQWPAPDLAALATHWRAAGDASRALPYALQAAGKAYDALAFDQAAQLYESALGLFTAESADRQRTRVRLAESLANVGRVADAARAFADAAAHAEGEQALDLHRREAEHLLNAGLFDQGERVMDEVLASVGLRLPKSSFGALAGLLAGRARLWMRGLDFVPRAEGETPRRQLTRLDACAGIALLLATVDTIRGAAFNTKTLLLALDAGEPVRVARALALEGALLGVAGAKSAERVDAILARVDTIVDAQDSAQLRGALLVARGFIHFLRGEFGEAHARAREGVAILSQSSAGAFWDLRTGQMVILWSLTWLGEVDTLVQTIEPFLRSADARGDLYGATSMRAGTCAGIAWLQTDEPERAQKTIRESVAAWTQRGYHLQHYWSLISESQVDLYCGRGLAVWERLQVHWPRARRSLVLAVLHSRVEAQYLRACAAIVSAQERPELEARMLRAAAKDARALEREESRHGRAMSLVLYASLAAIEGDAARSV